jgi:hypothetical protein
MRVSGGVNGRLGSRIPTKLPDAGDSYAPVPAGRHSSGALPMPRGRPVRIVSRRK